jgi:hypothetical protein
MKLLRKDVMNHKVFKAIHLGESQRNLRASLPDGRRVCVTAPKHLKHPMMPGARFLIPGSWLLAHISEKIKLTPFFQKILLFHLGNP